MVVPVRPRAAAPGSARRELAAVVAALALNAAFLLVLARHGRTAEALGVAALPLVALVFSLLVASTRAIVAFLAIAFDLSLGFFQAPVHGHSLYAADLLVLFLIAAWGAARLLGRPVPLRRPRTPWLAESAGLFVLFWAIALVRGHEHFGQKLYGEPLRLVLYAAIALALTEAPPRALHRGFTFVLYAGTVFMLFNMLYLIATGGTATDSADLSTGGKRWVALTVAMYLASALYMALLNLELAETGRQALLHLGIAAIAFLQIVLAFGRTTYLALAVALPFVIVASPRARRKISSLLPLVLPVIVATAVLVSIAMPRIPRTLIARLNIGVVTSHGDASVDWRLVATHEIMKQFHSSPFFGVGFGEGTTFTLNNATYTIAQDPHDSYVWLLAAGGVLLLGAFACVVIACFAAGLRRLRRAEGRERLLVVWALASAFTFLLNVGAGPLLSVPDPLLAIWLFLLLPLRMRTEAAEPAPG